MSNRLRLTLCCGDYDITRALVDGQVRPDGIDLISLTMPSPERHWRMINYQEFDVCEFSMCQYLVSKSTDAPMVAIPVFPHRRFRHSYIFINSNGGDQKRTVNIGFPVSGLGWTDPVPDTRDLISVIRS